MKAMIISHAAMKSVNRRLYRDLVARGCEVTVVIPDRWSSAFGPVKAEPELSSLRVITCKRFGISHSNVYSLKSLEAIVEQANPDAFYVDEDPAGLAAAQTARIAKRRGAGLVVLAIQNIVKKYPPPFNTLQKYVFDRAHAAVSISDQAAKALRTRGFTGQMTAMPFSTDLTPPDPRFRENTRKQYGFLDATVGYVGRLVSEKGVDVFLRALAQLPGIQGAIVGDGPERGALERLAAELQLNDRVTFLGAQTSSDAVRIVGALDALILPSRTRPNWSEQFGRILIEAMASGVPVVASDSGAISEVVGEAGILVPEDDVHGFALGLAHALEPSTARTLRERGLARVAAHFSPAVEANALYRALEFSASQGARVC